MWVKGHAIDMRTQGEPGNEVQVCTPLQPNSMDFSEIELDKEDQLPRLSSLVFSVYL